MIHYLEENEQDDAVDEATPVHESADDGGVFESEEENVDVETDESDGNTNTETTENSDQDNADEEV